MTNSNFQYLSKILSKICFLFEFGQKKFSPFGGKLPNFWLHKIGKKKKKSPRHPESRPNNWRSSQSIILLLFKSTKTNKGFWVKSVTFFGLFFGMYTYLSKTVPPGTVVSTAKNWHSGGRICSESVVLLILLCCCVPACVYLSVWNQSLLSACLFAGICTHSSKIMPEKKTVSPGTVVSTARTDIPVVQYARNRSSSRSPVLLSVSAPLPLSRFGACGRSILL